ncbi:hypothetical protein FE634_00825 [Nocardioides dongxiaopingii]|uniref:hypothetical protein n=1 Tax=Nocardioides sp. S-1144 TaxID=2582905 RepID=UPI00110E34C4|nr:hypothetical protein [Nocardioides sp. S-1144]QCW49321.1 hypothetical protein FE634_00825 [Nocardioides sp. S-1144]
MRTNALNIKRSIAGIAGIALLAIPLTACGSEDDTTSSSSSSSSSSESSAKPQAVAAIDALEGQDTRIALDKGFTDALTALELTPGVVGDAKLEGGSLIFPITGGNVSVFEPDEVDPYVIGQIQHEGSGLSLTAGDTTVELTNFNVDPGVSRVYGDVTVNGKVAVTSAFLFQLDGRTLEPLQTEGSTAILEGTQVKISPVAAPLLNETFGTDKVTLDLLVGIAKITVDVPA